ncbi:NAD-dependent epimerase/dehydratase family protein [Halopenitus persicus]|uniref:Nucleoside-diphosphate-sugar epimerase n=1 Tax=Halopenitus persicus TaxID=1048396 RepID=A0A1H3IZY7_9EURY|nr:NAD-dependent epimerase/dehydratase family protein [Halopenitus persicus]SDY33127.1 Nucleoside-diphosphate-sugar epimerase [Halopenitus persicus]
MDFGGSRVLVTGGGGFLGSHLVDRLITKDCEVVVADDFSRGRVEHIEQHENDIDLVPVDLTTPTGCQRATEDVDYVFHLAASVGGIHYIQRENVGGLTPSVLMNHHLLDEAHRNDVDRFLFASSACIYRQQHDGLNRFSEEQAIPADPHSTYGWAKILGEVGCHAYHEDTEMDCGMVRIFNAYGTRENLDPESSHVIPSLCRKVIEEPDGGSIELFGDGTQKRGFIYATDCVEGMIRAMANKTDGEAVNLGNGKEVVSINDLAETIIEISGKDLTIEHDTSKPTGTDKYAADTTLMEESLDWHPEVTLEDGVREVYEWAEEKLASEQAIEGTV